MATKTKKETATQREHHKQMEFLYGKENAKKSIYQIVHHVHHETVRHCDYCGKPMTRSDVNDYGSLCESCYMEEYYG